MRGGQSQPEGLICSWQGLRPSSWEAPGPSPASLGLPEGVQGSQDTWERAIHRARWKAVLLRG